MYYIGRSSVTLLVICLCLFSVAECLVTKPAAYSFGDRIPSKAVDLQSSPAERKTQVVRSQPEIPKKIEITSLPEIKPIIKQTEYVQKPIIAVRKQHSRVSPVVYNMEPKPKKKTETLKLAETVATTAPQIKHVKPAYYIIKKPTTSARAQKPSASPVVSDAQQLKLHNDNDKLLTKKVLQKPLIFSYNDIQPKKDLKIAATHNENHEIRNPVKTVEGSSDIQDHATSGSHIIEESEHAEDGSNNDNSKEPKDWSYDKGNGKSQHSGHYSSEGDKGEENYDGEHEYKKAEKGHHDKEGHRNRYEDESGNKKSHYYDDGLYGEYHKGEKGEKGSKFDDEGEYSKGHSTRGEHNIHKKEEYEKNHEFYDEFHEGGDEEKHGDFHHETDYKKGGSRKSGHDISENHKDLYGKKGHHEKGEHYDESKGHKIADGHDGHYKHKKKHGKKGARQAAKKWGYKKGEGSRGHNGGHAHSSGKVHGPHRVEPDDYGYDFARHYIDTPGDHRHIRYIITHY